MQIYDSADTLRMIKAIAGTSSLRLVEARGDQPVTLRLDPGQEVRGEVIASLVNGRFLVKIAGELLDMNLPSSIKPGEMVQLTFMTDKPRMTFSLDQQGERPAPVSLSDAGRWLALLARTPSGEPLDPEEIAKTVQSAVKDAVLIPLKEGAVLRGMTLGVQVRAEVLAELPDGRFQVRLADEVVEMNLPKGVRSGSEIQMMLVSDKPQVMLAMSQQPQNSANPLGETGRWLSFAARTSAADLPPPPAPLLPAGAEPGTEFSATALAGKLREALTGSGLFYESHVTDWAASRTRLEELLNEPQGKLSRLKQMSAPAAQPFEAGDTTLRESIGHEPVQPGMAAAGRDVRPSELADQQTLPIIRQQLALLQNGQFIWQGQAWSGQHMEWTVGERERESDDGPGRKWKTSLSLELPRLGRVKADLDIRDGCLNVAVNADNRETTAMMEQHVQKLRDGFAAAGLKLTGVVISNEE